MGNKCQDDSTQGTVWKSSGVDWTSSKVKDKLFYFISPSTTKKQNKSTEHLGSVTQSCPTLCGPMRYSTPGLPVQHQLLEPTQTHVHWVDDAIQLSHPLPPSSPPALSLSSIRFYSNQSALHVRRPKYWSFSFSISHSNIQGYFPLGLTGLISLLSKGLSRAFSRTTVQTHQFFSAQPSLWSVSHIHIWLLEKP